MRSTRSTSRSNQVASGLGGLRTKWAQIIGVTRKRNHRRYCDRKGERHREFAENAADQPGHEQKRDERRHQRDADREHGEADLPRALDCRAERRHSLFEITEAVLDHDDGVVDHEADGYGERHQREIVDGEAGEPHRAQVPASDSGTVTPAAMVAAVRRRNRKTTSMTSAMVASSVSCMSRTLARMVCVRSDRTEISMAGDIHRLSSGSSS